MKRSGMRVTVAAVLALSQAAGAAAWGQDAGGQQAGGQKAGSQEAQPEFSVDAARLPEVPQVQSKLERERQTLLAAGIGGVLGIVAADVLTGGLLLAPLGLPTFSALVGGGAAATPAAAAAPAVAVAAPTYTVAQQVLAGMTSMLAALGGGYIGTQVAGPVQPP
jgi:hypothetical protein